MMVNPAHKVCKRACADICVCADLNVCCTHLSIFPSAVQPIILSIWQPQPVKKTFLLATFFSKAHTEDSQPQEPHILQSTCILGTVCITEPPQSPSLSLLKHTQLISPCRTHTRYCSHPPLSLCNILTQALRANRFQSQSCPTNCASRLSVNFAPYKVPSGPCMYKCCCINTTN